jgi:hypothetical protein
MSEQPRSDFLKYAGTPFEPYILPIIPAGAKLTKNSTLTPKHLGKVPGIWLPDVKRWRGFPGWQRHRACRADLVRWQGWQERDNADTAIAIGLQLGHHIVAANIDIGDAAIADLAERIVIAALGKPLCVRRTGGSPRRVLFYAQDPKAMPITKDRLAFTAPNITGDNVYAVEILGLGQQVAIEGPAT